MATTFITSILKTTILHPSSIIFTALSPSRRRQALLYCRYALFDSSQGLSKPDLLVESMGAITPHTSRLNPDVRLWVHPASDVLCLVGAVIYGLATVIRAQRIAPLIRLVRDLQEIKCPALRSA